MTPRPSGAAAAPGGCRSPVPCSASTFGAMSVTPSLVPRAWFLQALVTGLCVVTGYGLGAFVGWAYRALRLPTLPDRARSVAWKALGVLAVVVLLVGRLARLAVAVRPARAARHGHLGATGLAACAVAGPARRRPAPRHRPGGQGPRPGRVPPARADAAGAGRLADRHRRHRRRDLPRVLRPPHREPPLRRGLDLREQQQGRQAGGGQPAGRDPYGWPDLGGHLGEHRPRGPGVRRVGPHGRRDRRGGG